MSYSTLNPPALVSQRVGSNAAIWMYKDGDSAATVDAINYFTNAQELGMKAGDILFHIDETNGVTTQLEVKAHRTSGTASGALASAVEPVGETSIALQSAGTGTFLVGDVVYFDNDPDSEYEVTTGDADISGGGTLVITPGLVTATEVGTKVKIKTDVLNVANAGTGARVITPPATYQILANESGSTFLYNALASQALTLPTAVPGMKFRFINTVLNTSNSHTLTAASGDFFVGGILGAVEGAATDEMHFADGTTDSVITQNRTTQGGLIGGHIEVECIAANLWYVTGVLNCTATPITPFS